MTTLHQRHFSTTTVHKAALAETLEQLPPHASADVFGAVMFGSTALVRRVLDGDSGGVAARDKHGNTPLHWAAFRSTAATVELLLERGANVNAVNATEGASVLHWACIAGNLRIVHLLRTRGADVHQIDKRGYNALLHAVQHNRLLTVYYVLRCAGVAIDSIDHDGHTALHWASYGKQPELCRFLVNLGAPLNARDNAGFTALRWAVEQSHGATARELLRLGADAALGDAASGATPLHVARLMQSAELVALLDDAGDGNDAARRRAQRRAELFWRAVVSVGIVLLLCAPVVALLYVLPAAALVGGAYVAVRGARVPAWLPQLERVDESPTRVLLLAFWLAYAVSFGIWLSDIRPSILLDAEAAAASGEPVSALFSRAALDLFTLLCAVHCACAAVSAFRSPGIVSDAYSLGSGSDAWLIAALESKSGAELPSVCVTCMKRRPLRSKHDRMLDACVLRFDHACVWIANSVGARNHGAFFVFLTLCVLLHNWLALWCVRLLWVRGELQWAVPRSPQIWVLAVFHVLNGVWEFSVLSIQVRCALENLTTNELVNRHRYAHFRGGARNPFDRGVLNNVLEMLTGRPDYGDVFQVDE